MNRPCCGLRHCNYLQAGLSNSSTQTREHFVRCWLVDDIVNLHKAKPGNYLWSSNKYTASRNSRDQVRVNIRIGIKIGIGYGIKGFDLRFIGFWSLCKQVNLCKSIWLAIPGNYQNHKHLHRLNDYLLTNESVNQRILELLYKTISD